jgi:hypothetical protein
MQQQYVCSSMLGPGGGLAEASWMMQPQLSTAARCGPSPAASMQLCLAGPVVVPWRFMHSECMHHAAGPPPRQQTEQHQAIQHEASLGYLQTCAISSRICARSSNVSWPAIALAVANEHGWTDEASGACGCGFKLKPHPSLNAEKLDGLIWRGVVINLQQHSHRPIRVHTAGLTSLIAPSGRRSFTQSQRHALGMI